MRQPIIDPAKVDAWTASMRDSFSGSDVGNWLIIGLTTTVLLVLIVAAWRSNRRSPTLNARPRR